MIFSARIKLLLVTVAVTLASSAITKYALIALAAVILIFREDVAVLTLSIRHSIQPQVIVRENYVYDPVNRIIHSFLVVEPMHDLPRLSEDKFVGLIDEMLLRLSLCTRCYLTFIVLNSRKIVRISMIDEPPFSRFKDFQVNVVKVLSDYFITRPLKGEELRSLINQSQYPMTSLALVLIVPLPLILFFGAMGLIPWVTYAFIIIKYYLSNRVAISDEPHFTRLSTKNNLMMNKLTNSDIYVLAKAFHNSTSEYALIISGNSGLSMLATKEYHKASESLIVKERGKSYPGLVYWRNVIDRLAMGEAPLRILLLTNTDVEYMGTVKSNIATYSLWVPEGFLLDGLSHDAAVFIPFIGGRLSLGGDGNRVIRIGTDSLGKPVEIDVDSLPAGHMLLLGPTGMGKSWTARTIVARLIKMGMNVIIIDPHGEYVSLKLPVIDASRHFIDFLNPPGHVDRKEVLLRVAQSISESFNINDLDLILSDLSEISNNDNFRVAFSKLAKRTLSMELSFVYDIIANQLGKEGVIDPDVLINGAILSFKSILPSPELTSFAMNQVISYLYSMFAGKRARLSNMLVIDEAYYVIGSRLMELYIRGLRKSGLGVLLITQTIGNISSNVIQNIPLIIMMSGPDSYIIESMNYLKLSQSEIEWLRLGLAPHMMGNKSRALLMEGPVRRQVLIDLDPDLKPAG